MEINNNITEDFCSLQVHKLLQNKGYDIKGNVVYRTTGNLESIEKIPHWKAIKWIRENFAVNINIFPELRKWDANIYSLKEKECLKYLQGYNSPEEAMESALLYTLNNLI